MFFVGRFVSCPWQSVPYIVAGHSTLESHLDGCVARAVYSICYTVFLLSEEEVVQGSTKYES